MKLRKVLPVKVSIAEFIGRYGPLVATEALIPFEEEQPAMLDTPSKAASKVATSPLVCSHGYV